VPSDVTKYDLFVSHNRRQKVWVREFVAFLRERGLRVFFDEDSIAPGEDTVEALERGVAASDSLVLVISRSSVFSKWVAFETTLKIYEDPDGTERRLIPVLVERVDRTLIRPAVRRLDTVDLTDPQTRDREFTHLMRHLGVKNAGAISFPPWPDDPSIEELFVGDIRTALAQGWSGEQLLERLIALDYQIMDGLTPEHEGEIAQWAPVFMDHPETWRLLVTPSHDIVGYWHFVPLFRADFDKACRGELRDSEITTDRVRVFELPGTYAAYAVTFGLLPRYRRTKAYKLLLDSFFDVLLGLGNDGIFLSEICTNAFSKSGEAMCKTFSFSYLRDHTAHGKIYHSRIIDLLNVDVCAPYREVRSLYNANAHLFSATSRIDEPR
jgi:hypothetical protein